MRCLVCFYGLNRSLRWTAKSIIRNILEPLSRIAEVRCVAHFNEPATINAEHSSEFNIPVTRHGVERLPLDDCLFEPQPEFELPDVPTPAPTMTALLSQLHSLKRVWTLATDCDVYLFIRPDLEYIDRLSPAMLDPILNGTADLITPNWDQFGGLNDRFAFCSRKGAEAYANRLDMVPRFCSEEGKLHAESLLSRVAQWSDLRLRYTSIRAMRVRANGATIREEFDLNPFVFVRGIARKRIYGARARIYV